MTAPALPHALARKRRPQSGAAQATERGHGARDRGRESAGRGDADRPQRQDRLSSDDGRAQAQRAAHARGRHLPHLFDDQADRLGRNDDAGRGGTTAAVGTGRQIPACIRLDDRRRRARRQVRARSGRTADHDSRPDAPHIRLYLRLSWNIDCPSAHSRGQFPRSEPVDGRAPGRSRGDCRCCANRARFGNTATRPMCSAGSSRSSPECASGDFCKSGFLRRSAWSTRPSIRRRTSSTGGPRLSPQASANATMSTRSIRPSRRDANSAAPASFRR